MIILLDQDGPLSDYTALMYERWVARHPEEFALHHVPMERVPYDLTNHYSGEVREHLKAIESEPGFFESLPPVPGAVEAAHELLAMGHNVCICTRPSRNFMEMCSVEKFRWVARHLGEVFTDRMMVVRDKTFAHGHILIDDKPIVTGNAEPVWQHVLYDEPYNRHVRGVRISWDSDWRSVIAELEEVYRERHRA